MIFIDWKTEEEKNNELSHACIYVFRIYLWRNVIREEAKIPKTIKHRYRITKNDEKMNNLNLTRWQTLAWLALEM